MKLTDLDRNNLIGFISFKIDMKIKLALSQTENKISEIEKKYMGKFIALLIGLIGEAVGLIISFIR